MEIIATEPVTAAAVPAVLEGQVAFITGASRGVGRAIALRMASEGADIAVHYRSDEAAAHQVADEIRALGRRVELYRGNMADRGDVDRIAATFRDQFDRLDILVNNAGVTRDNLLLTMSDEELTEVITTNLLGPIRLTRALAMMMLGRRYGRIVNISSSAASKPGRGQSNYAAAKGGLEAFTKALAVELAPKGVLVNAVAPGVIDTAMSEHIRAHGEAEIYARLLLKRIAEPSEVADAVMYLASPRNRYVTGEILHLDGGLKMA
ncbi:3-oxoacyl-ACP reductase family protein [Tahibacter amnicola]|uniref:3-oxoacyl-ACP reductase FabG n=1 Tax=Tahibacter amnicola TaxID=2976241 RepID=A0ABY6BH49_9GAMM|nr:3-oxoacyl-ACP reductase family protein [Tahibacter amnicola]UXI69107.1 3-oxoacyl-ACP reductase FabG [Tahibacter amnicola]